MSILRSVLCKRPLPFGSFPNAYPPHKLTQLFRKQVVFGRERPFSPTFPINRTRWHWWATGIALTVSGLVIASQQLKQSKKITPEELQAHKSVKDGLWIAWQDPQDTQWYVSAMADFVENHPGGSRIEEAGGQTAMQYWQQFARHLDPSGNPKPQVLQELRSRIVGVLTEPPIQASLVDPYSLEPDRTHITATPLQLKPYNASQKPLNLINFVTGISDLFVRFHTPAPLIKNHKLSIESPNASTVITLETLKQFTPLTYTSVLQCAGHRRSEMSNTNGLQWEAAIANVEITGYRLWDLLKSLGIQPEIGKYLIAAQLDDKGMELFSTCIPLHLLPENTLLATEMNGEPLTRDHGGPLRLWVPGFNGHFSVKTPTQIKIVPAEAGNVEKQEKYKELGVWAPAVGLSSNLPAYVREYEGKFFFKSELEVNSIALVDRKGLQITPGMTQIPLRGWAWSGGGRDIVSVQVSPDGKTWHEAKLEPHIQQPPNQRYAWTGWTIDLPILEESTRAFIRAKDSGGNVQPKRAIWNPRGLGNNSWTEVPFYS